MKNEKKVKYKDIGEILYRRNTKARNLAIRINADGLVKVTVPGRCSFHRAESFVLDKKDWISKKTHYIKRKKEENLAWQPGDLIRMRNGYIRIILGATGEFVATRVHGGYELAIPEDYDAGDAGHSTLLHDHIAAIGLKEAKEQLPGVLNLYAERFRLPYRKVSVRRMRTRWGSCSAQNNISLNSSLVFLPEHLVEYICLHELIHTVHKDHSRNFWNALVRILPDAMQRRRELRNTTIIA